MKESQYRKKIDKKIFRIIVAGILGIILLSVIAFFVCFRITEIEVDGNHHYTEKEIQKMVMKGPFKSNSILFPMTDIEENTKDTPFIQAITVERLSPNKIAIHVVEKELIGYVPFLDGYMYFDKKGIIAESTVEPLEGVPYIEGLEFDHVALKDKLPIDNEDIFNTILSLSRMIAKNEIEPDRIVLDKKYNITLYYGDIQVTMGEDSYLEEKVTHLAAILPYLEEKKGLLHLENITNDAKNVTFEKDGASDSDEDSQDSGEKDKTIEAESTD